MSQRLLIVAVAGVRGVVVAVATVRVFDAPTVCAWLKVTAAL
jgi:hypothetical protein